MSDLWLYVVSFLVTVGVLVVVHEFGHYLAARWMDVKILRFNIGFGKPLLIKRRGPDRTEWVVAALPLGGYVKMLDEREGIVAEHEKPRAFNNKNVWARIFIVLAGPIANFLLAFVLYWILFVAGVPGDKPVLSQPPANTPAAMAGLAEGDTVVAVADEPVGTFNDVRWQLLKEAVKHEQTLIEVQTRQGTHATRRIDLSGVTRDDLDQDLLGKIGVRLIHVPIPPRLGNVISGRAGDRAGLRSGDLVVAVNGKPMSTFDDLVRTVLANTGLPMALDVERAGQRIRINVTPELRNGNRQLGIQSSQEDARIAYAPYMTTVRFGPVDALGQAARKVADLSLFSLKMLGRMVTGDVSWKNLSGPITIADYAGQSAKLGWLSSLSFLALVSVSLGVLNLLPIPLLDGGHLVYYFAEIVKGTPVSERTMEIGQRFGLALLLGLTFFAFYNDINRLFTG
jgi:regulator of sigma E protease